MEDLLYGGRMLTYQPLSSVWEGKDPELLERMLSFYSTLDSPRILDATAGKRRMWKGSAREVTFLDIDPDNNPDVIGDNRDMPFADSSFDVVVYDPPHLMNKGRDKDTKYHGFGLHSSPVKAKKSYSVSFLFPPFFAEASRVLSPKGIVLAKICDMVHNHRFQWQHIDMVSSGAEAGFTPCDMIITVRKAPMTSSKWKKAKHARKRHSFWIVFRKGSRCEP